MNNLSMNQALSIWSDLDDAYHGKNGFGGDTAEIYMYRLMPYSPSVTRALTDARDVVRAANKSLFYLLAHFRDARGVEVWVNDAPLGAWLMTATNDHRVHVRIKRQQPKGWRTAAEKPTSTPLCLGQVPETNVTEWIAERLLDEGLSKTSSVVLKTEIHAYVKEEKPGE